MESPLLKVTVSGVSMFPSLKEGDNCYVELDQQASLGDLVCLRRHDTSEYIIHRLLDEKRQATKGDNSLYWDEPTNHTILGVVKMVSRHDRVSEERPNLILSQLSKYTSQHYFKPIRVGAKVLMRLYLSSF